MTAVALLATFRVPAKRGEHNGTKIDTRYFSDSDDDQTSPDSEFKFDDFTEICTLLEQEKPVGACFAGESSSAGNSAA